MRFTKSGAPIWLQASYNPVAGEDGVPFKVVKVASDISAAKLRNADFEGKLQAVERVQASIEFDLTGRILHANDNFLKALGYSLDEVVGQHHRIFCHTEFAHSAEYAMFWERLGRGEFNAGEYRRIDKHGKDVWILASYNPIFDAAGKAIKVIKYATDITAQKERNADIEGKLDAIGRSQAVIEFDLRGTILSRQSEFLAGDGLPGRRRGGPAPQHVLRRRHGEIGRIPPFLGRPGPGQIPVGPLPPPRQPRRRRLDPGHLQPDLQ